ncbi:unnamed protein product [Chrysoparadoxa australica]
MESDAEPGHQTVSGMAVICLPPVGSWFQGQAVIPSAAGGPVVVGLLATELSCDPCMECSSGGYARHKLQFTNSKAKRSTEVTIVRSGGSLVEFSTEQRVEEDPETEAAEAVSFRTETCKSGPAALPTLRSCFKNIVNAALGDEKVSSHPPLAPSLHAFNAHFLSQTLEQCIVCHGGLQVSRHILQALGVTVS